MAETNEVSAIVQALLIKTRSGKLSWKIARRGSTQQHGLPIENSPFDEYPGPTDLGRRLGGSDVYVVRLGSGFVTMTRVTPEYDPDFLSLAFFDVHGNISAEYKIETGQDHWEDLNEIINEIHKSLFGFKSLMKELVG